MFKVLIADDEYLICELIQSFINWSELDLELVGVANNGIDAYNLLIEHRPEILITDIKMPRLDGLELVKRVKEENIPCKFVIISGHRHFEYAHNALKYNVEDYLLKPINKKNLNSTLQKICRALMEERLNIKEKYETNDKLENRRISLRRHFINYATSELNKSGDINLDMINQEYGLSFSKGIFQAAFVKIDIGTFKPENVQYDFLLNKIVDICTKRLRGLCYEFIASSFNNGVLIVMNYDSDTISLVKKERKQLFEDIIICMDMFSDFAATLGMGIVEDSIEGISKSIATSLNAVKCRLVLGRNRIIDATVLNYRITELKAIITADRERELSKVFEALDNEGFEIWLNDNLKLFNIEVHPVLLYELSEKVVDMFLRIGKNLKLKLDEEKALKDEILSYLDRSNNMEDILRSIYEPISLRIKELTDQKIIMDSKPIRDAKQYIAEHYMEQVMLEDIAKIVFLNPVYLSTVFKKQTGVNFVDYLTNYRIDIAKELLISTNYSIADIAMKVGYIEPRYFSKIFIKTVGIKPKDYRKLYC